MLAGEGTSAASGASMREEKVPRPAAPASGAASSSASAAAPPPPAAAAPSSSAAAPPPPAAAAPSSSEAFLEERASIYPRGGRHGPRPRADTLEAALLLNGFSLGGGFTTLALGMACWTALLALALPAAGLGPPLHLSIARDFGCPEAARDVRALLRLLLLLSLWSLAAPWALVQAYSAGRLTPVALVSLHFGALAALAGLVAAANAAEHPMAPLWGVLGGIAIATCGLKAHSFVFTHIAPLAGRRGAPPPPPPPLPPPPSLRSFAYFMLCPSLCWEPLGFPVSGRVRPARVATWLTLAAGAGMLQYFVLREALLPVLTEDPTRPGAFPSLPPLLASLLAFGVDMARLAVPSLLFWLLLFAGVFVGWLNALAEVMRFADHRFYLPVRGGPPRRAAPRRPTRTRTHTHTLPHTPRAVVGRHLAQRVLEALELARAPLVRAAPAHRGAGVPLGDPPRRRGNHLLRQRAAARAGFGDGLWLVQALLRACDDFPAAAHRRVALCARAPRGKRVCVALPVAGPAAAAPALRARLRRARARRNGLLLSAVVRGGGGGEGGQSNTQKSGSRWEGNNEHFLYERFFAPLAFARAP
jgi:hypothetical protein